MAKQQDLFRSEATAPEKVGARVVARIDGGARGNPGPAGYGVVLEDSSGKVFAELSRYLGHCTNNVAEYSGLLAALEKALEMGAANLRVLSDSELLVRQMNGQYKVKSPDLRPLYEEARRLSRKFVSFRIEHVRREQNRAADKLANRAMDEGA